MELVKSKEEALRILAEVKKAYINAVDENKRLKATVDAYAKQINRLEQRLLKYEKVHDGKFIEKDITTSESKPLLNN